MSEQERAIADEQDPATSKEHSSWRFDEGAEIVPGRYALSKLGGGSRYEVYLAVDDALLTLVVLKILRPNRVEEEGANKDLAQEAEMLSSLAHPSLVRMFDAQLGGPRPHLVLEHIEGPTLRRLIKRSGAVALEQALPLALHVCSVLHYLEGRGVVHLDVKPDNIVMADTPRLIDLSIARTVEHAQRTRGVLGTYAYMSPEQCVPGSAPLGTPADVWGLGTSLFHAATGTHPFPKARSAGSDVDPGDLPQVHEDPLVPEGVPADLADILLRCLERDPAARPRASEVAMALEPIVALLPRSVKIRFRR